MKPTSKMSWLSRGHVPDVCRIEGECFRWPLDSDDIREVMRERNRIGRVLVKDAGTVGYILYDLHGKHVTIVRIAVLPKYQRQGIATSLLLDVFSRTLGTKAYQGRHAAKATISESQLSAQLLFRNVGFRCVGMCEGGGDWLGDAGSDLETEDAMVFGYDERKPYVHFGGSRWINSGVMCGK